MLGGQDGVANATMDFLTSYVDMLKRATRVAPEQVPGTLLIARPA